MWSNLKNCSKRSRKLKKISKKLKLTLNLCMRGRSKSQKGILIICRNETYFHLTLIRTLERFPINCLINSSLKKEILFQEEFYHKDRQSPNKISVKPTNIIQSLILTRKAIPFPILAHSSTLTPVLRGVFCFQGAVRTTKETCCQSMKSKCCKIAWGVTSFRSTTFTMSTSNA